MSSSGSIINLVILLLAFITVAGFCYVVYSIAKINNSREERRKKNRTTEYTKGGIVKSPDAETWEEILNEKEEFNGILVKYAMFSQLIPIFPLLGILGTVLGLIQQMDAGVDRMREALGTSMWTTFWGLIAAIALKLADALFVSRSINKMDNYFETFEQNYQMVRDKIEQENEKN